MSKASVERKDDVREGRYRRKSPERQYGGPMREALKERVEGGPASISRDEVEEIGARIGLEDPSEAARLFDRLKGVSWRGEYVERGENGWAAAHVTEVS